ncbi:MAG: peptidase M48 [Burkholderiales bacterium RIFCSPLOWO2_02_FULL_57_36]|nr:MAG: peptidase M48 [Burkholderiales bacterium RIFCSPLOWO2_02_FULL_57_36]
MDQPPALQTKRAALLCRTVLLPAAMALAACTTQFPPSQPESVIIEPQVSAADQATLRSLISHQDRLYRVAGPLLVNNPDLCKGNARNLLGFTAKNKYSYSAELVQAAQTLFGLGDRLQIMGVLVGSGASRVGLRRDDQLIEAEGHALPQGPNAEREAAAMLTPLVGTSPSIRLTVLRAGANTVLNVPLTRACAYSIELGNVDTVNAYDDGRRVMITRGMMNFAQTDEELAYVLAKEMAHNSLGHAGKQNMSATVGGIIDNLIRIRPDLTTLAGTSGVRPMPQELDAAADTLSLYMLARAGYNVDRAARFWEKLANQYPRTVLNGYTAIHPSTAFRLSVMARIVADVKAKQAGRKPLSP